MPGGATTAADWLAYSVLVPTEPTEDTLALVGEASATGAGSAAESLVDSAVPPAIALGLGVGVGARLDNAAPEFAAAAPRSWTRTVFAFWMLIAPEFAPPTWTTAWLPFTTTFWAFRPVADAPPDWAFAWPALGTAGAPVWAAASPLCPVAAPLSSMVESFVLAAAVWLLPLPAATTDVCWFARAA